MNMERNMRTIFSDKSTIILRAMLSEPQKKWVARDFEQKFNIGKSRAASVLSILRKKGLAGGVASGRSAYNTLLDPPELLEEWTKFYSFDLNRAYLCYSSSGNILSRLKAYFLAAGLSEDYALTLHSGANLITNYVNVASTYLYLGPENFEKKLFDMRQALDLKELKRGGNIYVVRPYYKKSVFLNKRKIRGFNVVSDLQLYLDLFNFPQRGRDHAQYLMKVLKEKGESFV